TTSLFAQLPRRAFLGTQLYTVNDSVARLYKLPDAQGALIQRVVENSSAQSVGLQPGDVIVSVQDKNIATHLEVVETIGSYREGDVIQFSYYRNGELQHAEAPLKGFPKETSEHAEVIYDAVPYDGGYVRTIIRKPPGEGPHPAFFFIQGAHCGSIDGMNPRSPVAMLLEGLTEKGYVVVKTEKAGVGDSRNNIHCTDCDLDYEIRLFTASFNQLSQYDFIDTSNVFVFGHSMGGVQAPLMQTDFLPKGIAVFGTVARPWFEYYIDIARKQRLMVGQDYLENEKHVARAIPFYYKLMIEKMSPEEMELDPELKDFMYNQWSYDGEGRFHGRHYTFWQQLQDTCLFTAWASTPAYVLSIWGEGEFVALNPFEHKLIADIVNQYNPGKARFYSMPSIDHGFVRVEDVQHAIDIRNDWEYQYTHFNNNLVDVLHEWMQEIIN
ncbi:MAG: PDZ domain-containing protein, partial [Bacteroidetes bacterium]